MLRLFCILAKDSIDVCMFLALHRWGLNKNRDGAKLRETYSIMNFASMKMVEISVNSAFFSGQLTSASTHS
jgi:hypothetical protein